MKLSAAAMKRLSQYFGELKRLDVPDADTWGRTGLYPIVFFDFTDLGEDERNELFFEYMADAFTDNGWLEPEDPDDDDSALVWTPEDVIPIAVIGKHRGGTIDELCPYLQQMDGMLFLELTGGEGTVLLWNIDAPADELIEVASSLDELLSWVE